MATDSISNEPVFVLPVELEPDVEHLVTEDDTPVDGSFSEKQMRLLTSPLYDLWAGERTFVAMANVGLFFNLKRRPLVPDVLLSVNVKLPPNIREKKHRSYFTWLYRKPPDVVIEIVSNSEGREDAENLQIYAEIGVPDYVIYDPDRLLNSEMLRVFRLREGEYYKTEEPIWFSNVGLGLRLWQGRFEECDETWLRWVDAKGIPVPTGQERAEAADERADAAEERAARLADQLRQLGVEPDNR
jgi:Uma2 family endonuclease